MSATLQYLRSDAAEAGLEATHLVDCMLLDAVEARASDIHVEPWENTLAVRLRLNGVLSELVHLPLDVMERVAGRFRVLADLTSYQTGLPQEGHARMGPDLANVELRVSVFPTTRGEKIVVRLFDPRSRRFDLADLGFDETTRSRFTHLLDHPNGLILLTGPTGSGKTTAIYSSLTYIAARSGPAVSISSVEDPVEFNLPMISQTQINLAREFTYARALRSLMRQDPQVIMVGEIRDAETAAIAVQAGLTGHLVISTIHSGIAAGVFARLMNMEIEPFLLASSIIGVMGIRLIRLNCKHCSQPAQPNPNLLARIPAEELKGANFCAGAGCRECHHTGFDGRTSVTELLTVNEVFRDAILKKLPTRTLQQVAVDQGMEPMWTNGLNLVLHGRTTLEELLRVLTVDQF